MCPVPSTLLLKPIGPLPDQHAKDLAAFGITLLAICALALYAKVTAGPREKYMETEDLYRQMKERKRECRLPS